MSELAEKFSAKDLIVLCMFGGIFLTALIWTALAFVQMMYTNRREIALVELKQDLANRGMTADQIVAVLEASMMKPNPGAAYNVCDDDPAPPQDVIAYACALLNVPAPPDLAWADAAPHMTEMARSFYADSKRVTNRRIKDELGVTLAYPDYRAGLKALMQIDKS